MTASIPDAATLLNATRDRVLEALPAHRVAHFSCHGYFDWTDPASGRLVLYDHETSPLTLADISALHLDGGLAYLSACDTAITSASLANESVHIASAFHLAGYQHVIGTLWPVSDDLAQALAGDFYSYLTRIGTSPPAPGIAAHALHHATRRLRDSYPGRPGLWAAHTHTGP